MNEPLESDVLAQFPWLRHGFGTRLSPAPEQPVAVAKQTHSVTVLRVDQPGPAGEGDALVTATPGLAVAVRTADCVPILLVDAEHRVVAAVHAGWRGTAGEIVCKCIEQMEKSFGTKPNSIYAAIGPAIGKCCYAVGPEVAREFVRWIPEAAGSSKLDLELVNFNQLQAIGVESDHIARLGLCTKDHPELFYSYRRRPGETGRMLSWISVRQL